MRKAFTLLELVFVIVVMGILANFGTNILVTSYTSYTASTTNNKILANVELTLKQISNRLQYRIKDSVISRVALNGAFVPIQGAAAGDRVIEWIGYDIDGWLGTALVSTPTWSGFIDLNDDYGFILPVVPAANAITSQLGGFPYLESPGTNTASVTATIAALANGSAATVGDAAIFFTGANTDVSTGYGWGTPNNVALNSQGFTAHPIGTAPLGAPAPITGTQLYGSTLAPSTFTGVDVYENYKLAWTAYAISHEDFNGDGAVYPAGHPLAGTLIRDLVFYYDYQPWNGITPNALPNPRRQLLLQNVDTFKFISVGETMQIQTCVNELDALGAGDGGYSVCEEIAIF